MEKTALEDRPVTAMRAAVIGSGAAAMACASALVDKGADVTVFDGGEQLEQERRQVMARMAAVRPAQWTVDDLRMLRGNQKADSRGIPKKLAFGSDYPFRDPHGLLNVEYDRTDLLYSLAQGGLTTMWGANVFPWRRNDFAGWPVQLSDLEPHYKAVLDFMPLAAAEDDLTTDLRAGHGRESPPPHRPQ
jgi:choline dehydrogenase-like flavoprotein